MGGRRFGLSGEFAGSKKPQTCPGLGDLFGDRAHDGPVDGRIFLDSGCLAAAAGHGPKSVEEHWPGCTACWLVLRAIGVIVIWASCCPAVEGEPTAQVSLRRRGLMELFCSLSLVDSAGPILGGLMLFVLRAWPISVGRKIRAAAARHILGIDCPPPLFFSFFVEKRVHTLEFGSVSVLVARRGAGSDGSRGGLWVMGAQGVGVLPSGFSAVRIRRIGSLRHN